MIGQQGIRLWAGLMALSAVAVSSSAAGEVLYSSISSAESGGWCFGDGGLAAAGIETPAGPGLVIDQLVVRLHDFAAEAAKPWQMDLHADDNGLPGMSLAVLGSGTGTGPDTFDLYTAIPGTRVELEPSSRYWIVMSSSSSDSCAFGWSVNGVDPAGGILTGFGAQQLFFGTWIDRSTGSPVQMEILGSPLLAALPVPVSGRLGLLLLSLLLALAALMFFRRTSAAA